jgi:glycosyltransferase involved in cell wall biosynthesis
MERLVFSMADVVVVPSDSLGRWTVQRYEVEPQRILVSAPSVPRVVTRPRHPAETPTFVSYGRLTEQKGVGDLVSAMVPVFDAHPSARLVFVGADGWSLCEDRPMSEVLRERIPQRHRDKVVFTGRVRRDAALDMLGCLGGGEFEPIRDLLFGPARRGRGACQAPDLPAFGDSIAGGLEVMVCGGAHRLLGRCIDPHFRTRCWSRFSSKTGFLRMSVARGT